MTHAPTAEADLPRSPKRCTALVNHELSYTLDVREPLAAARSGNH
jgi:hypothetical protein